jgi:hypothetical protein
MNEAMRNAAPSEAIRSSHDIRAFIAANDAQLKKKE